jgi:hypothetical protein
MSLLGHHLHLYMKVFHLHLESKTDSVGELLFRVVEGIS